MEQQKQPTKWNLGSGERIALCIAFGVVLGMFFDNVAMGIAIGIAAGAGWWGATERSKDKAPHESREQQRD